jgi:DNA-directed RNA polymerase alpha subunit
MIYAFTRLQLPSNQGPQVPGLPLSAASSSPCAIKRPARETADVLLIAPTPELPDEMPIEKLQLTTRVYRALSVEGIKTVGEIREKSDGYLLSFQNLGKRSIEHLRITLGRRPADNANSSV